MAISALTQSISKASALREGKSDWAFGADSFAFADGADHYRIQSDGHGVRFRNAGTRQTFYLPVPRDFYIEAVHFTRALGDPLLIYQVTDEESGGGIAARLDSTTLALRWQVRMPGFNVGAGLVDGPYVFVNCIGFVGKLDLRTGEYAWRQPDLWTSDRFNGSAVPEVNGDWIAFLNREGRLLFHRETGVPFGPR